MKTAQLLEFFLIPTAFLPVATACRQEVAPLPETRLTCSTSISFQGGGVSSFGVEDSIEVFIYDVSGQQRLDACQKSGMKNGKLQIQSRSGNKRVVAVKNARRGFFNYSDIICYEGMRSICYDIADENPEKPVLCGELDMTAGPGTEYEVSLSPLLAEVRINSLKVDFSKRPYRNSEFRNARAYLINVNGLCPILEQARGGLSIYNYGRFDGFGNVGISHPEMFEDKECSGSPMYCYPNAGTSSGNAPGVCTTRLVVEGQIEGVTYYYPVNVGDGTVRRGHRYIYDITITRTGTTDPDIPADDTMLTASIKTLLWEEYEMEEIHY